jgi:GTP-binding protein
MTLTRNNSIRNIAIIAHVDHGKTTLVDHMFRQAGVFAEHQELQDRVMDSMDLERERGITIAAKNCSIQWKNTRINILDTPGHSDFGGEVERALMMVDGAVLLVDSSEGPLPQTRFVLSKALQANKKIIVVVNKIDRKDARPKEILDEVYNLFIDLDANDEQIDFPVLYAIGRDGIAKKTLDGDEINLSVLFDQILETIPGPEHNTEEPFQMLCLNLTYSDYLGRLAIGRVFHGSAQKSDKLCAIGEDNKPIPLKVTKLQVYEGVGYKEVEVAQPGDVIILAGADDIQIGDTICSRENPKALPRVVVDEPTIAMRFGVNSSPLAGKEGKIVQFPRIKERLYKETLTNVALKVEESSESEHIIVKGRGEFQMAIIIEQMRREGFELSVGRPEIIMKKTDAGLVEPIEHLFVDCSDQFIGVITEKLSRRKGKMLNMINHGTGRVRLEFSIPSRGLIGYRNEFLTDTRGTGLMNSYLQGYEPFRGEIESRLTGSLVADREGDCVGYALFHLEPRGTLFVTPGEPAYEGMIVGECNKDGDLNVNVSKAKKLTNVRASGKDDALTLTPVSPMSLEKAIEFIRDDEMVEVTPKSIRLRKIILPQNKRS